MSVNHLCALCLQRSGEGTKSSNTGVIDDCESPYLCWEPNPGSSARAQCSKPVSQLSSPV